MQRFYLNGNISQFGSEYEVSCYNIANFFKLLGCQIKGFREYLIEAAEAGTGFEVVRGSEIVERPEDLLLSINDEDVYITEVPAGAKSGGAKILAAVAIVALMVVTGGLGTAGLAGWASTGLGNIAGTMLLGMAVNLAITGITQLMAPGPETEGRDDPGYLFNGPVNSIKQGFPVPVLYGELIVGGAPISATYLSSPFVPPAEPVYPDIDNWVWPI